MESRNQTTYIRCCTRRFNLTRLFRFDEETRFKSLKMEEADLHMLAVVVKTHTKCQPRTPCVAAGRLSVYGNT